jgi:DNA-binding MarR family transcriptional regulator
MRAAGLVTLAAGPDRRTRLIRLTPEALTLVERLQPIWEATARAAAELDTALPAPLGAVLDAALASLNDIPFEQRIAHQMEEI